MQADVRLPDLALDISPFQDLHLFIVSISVSVHPQYTANGIFYKQKYFIHC